MKELSLSDLCQLQRMVFDNICKENREYKAIEWSVNDSKICLDNDDCEDDWDNYRSIIGRDTKRLEESRKELVRLNRLESLLSDMIKEIR